MNLLVLSTSLNPESNSRVLATAALRSLTDAGHAATFTDLRELPLPLCDGASAYQHEQTAKARTLIAWADGRVVATPSYNYDANAALKNLIELTGKAWEDKIVGFACCAGGGASYMSIMALANSLMLDFRCTIVPRFIYATEADFNGATLINTEVARRTAQLAADLARYTHAVRG